MNQDFYTLAIVLKEGSETLYGLYTQYSQFYSVFVVMFT